MTTVNEGFTVLAGIQKRIVDENIQTGVDIKEAIARLESVKAEVASQIDEIITALSRTMQDRQQALMDAIGSDEAEERKAA